MQGRKTVYNSVVTPEKLAQVNPENIQLRDDFLEYLSSIDRSPKTIQAYKYDINLFFVWLLENCNNKFFVDLKKREIAKFQSYALNEYGWSPARIRRVKSTLSSMSNFVENILDDEFENFRPIIRKIENPVNNLVREKTVFTKEQLQGLLDQLVKTGHLDQACMLSLAMNCGKRKSELPRIKASFFNEENLMYGSLYKSPEKIQSKGRGSKGKMIPVYVFKKDFQPYLDMWMQYREENGITAEWLIPYCKNGVWTDEQVPITTMNSWAETFTKMLGVPFYWHSIRHFWCSEASRNNLPDSVIKELSSWNDISMVATYKDIEAEEEFAKYFDENGIKQVQQANIADL